MIRGAHQQAHTQMNLPSQANPQTSSQIHLNKGPYKNQSSPQTAYILYHKQLSQYITHGEGK